MAYNKCKSTSNQLLLDLPEEPTADQIREVEAALLAMDRERSALKGLADRRGVVIHGVLEWLSDHGVTDLGVGSVASSLIRDETPVHEAVLDDVDAVMGRMGAAMRAAVALRAFDGATPELISAADDLRKRFLGTLSADQLEAVEAFVRAAREAGLVLGTDLLDGTVEEGHWTEMVRRRSRAAVIRYTAEQKAVNETLVSELEATFTRRLGGEDQ